MSKIASSQPASSRMVKTDQINLRLPITWIMALSETAGRMAEETGEDFNTQDIIKLCLMEKFGLPS